MRAAVQIGIFGAIFALAASVAHGQTESPPPFPEFTFKRVKPPQPGATRRITVQIAPDAPTDGARIVAVPTPDMADWFWNALPATGSGPRFEAAMTAVASGPVAAPRLDDLFLIAEAFGTSLLLATIGTNVSPALALAVIAVESGGDPDALSPAGASGLMQLMPDTATRFGVGDAADPGENISGGVQFLNLLLGKYDGDLILALAAYNAGDGAVRDAGGVPDFPETRMYVPKVIAAYATARGLCVTPPQLFTDGCVFIDRNKADNG